MTERDVDFIEIRSKYRSKFSWPLNIFFGIAAFEPVQNVYNFIAHGTLLVTSFIPFEIRKIFQQNKFFIQIATCQQYDYLAQTIRLTRFRSYDSRIV